MAVIDISMPRLNDIEVISEIKKNYSAVKALTLTMHKDEDYSARAEGYLLKDHADTNLLQEITANRTEKVYSPIFNFRDDYDTCYRTEL